MNNNLVKVNDRLEFLNTFKALLLIGMITGHALMLIANSSPLIATYYKTYINLITFSGFCFAFGFLYEMLYFQKDIKFIKALLTFVKMISAFLISAVSYRMLIKPATISLLSILKILSLQDIPGYSEFLLAFALLSACAFAFALLPNKIKNSKSLIFSLLALSILSALIFKTGVKSTLPALFLGSVKFGAFPVIQYSFWFWLGVLYKRNLISLNWLFTSISLLFTASFLAFFISENHFPARFSPSPLWIIGSAFPILLYLKASLSLEKIKSKKHIYSFIQNLGENTLFHLLMSNIFLFILSTKIKTNSFTALIIGILVIFINSYLIWIIRKR